MSHLNIAEAVPLGYAMVARVAADAGVRALAIKGPFLQHLGLRDRKLSRDIDFLVDPEGLDGLRTALEGSGWLAQDVGEGLRILEQHSLVMRHAAWPCELDLHAYFPGMTAPRQSAFDYIWERREEFNVAGALIPGHNYLIGFVIYALHLLRDPVEHSNSLRSLRRQAESIEGNVRVRIAKAATDVGAAHAMQALLPELAEPAKVENGQARWNLRVAAGAQPGVALVAALKDHSPRYWISILRRQWSDIEWHSRESKSNTSARNSMKSIVGLFRDLLIAFKIVSRSYK